ncbi:LptA/OstA family protein [Candidatus Cyanaurora vandensis]|uniref:LptA/OstA family protein n=1 Tax=Candidatus Cyanaurora vandensis TaxID=2714958 RepID=UPI00257D3694|nr:LptA/OstA family protein [Candidatus Cyanaurora vandensis]
MITRLLLFFALWLVLPVQAQSNNLTIRSDVQEANSGTGVVVARGNVLLEYPSRQLTARAKQAIYNGRQGTVLLIGNVVVDQRDRDQLSAEKITYYLRENRLKAEPPTGQQVTGSYNISEGSKTNATFSSDVQEATAGVVTATGNIRFEYPARQIIATAQKATFNNKERTVVMQGNVSVLQQGGNTIQAESVTYAIDESRFIAAPTTGGQVRATYTLPPETKSPPR